MYTEILWTKLFKKHLQRVPHHVQIKTRYWIRMVTVFGLRDVRKQAGFHDEALKGKRKGQRSIRVSRSYRLIYKELDKQTQIKLLELIKHEY